MITVIGAANVDITATPLGKYIPRDSNPSRVEIGFGGVGRNIAHNLCLLGNEVRLFTVFGDDRIALTLRDDCRNQGIIIDPILEMAGTRSNYFICVNDNDGEMLAGAADMELMEHLTAQMVADHMSTINSSDAVVADCNPNAEVLQYLAEHCTAPLYIDATSAAKSLKIISLMPVHRQAPLVIKVNRTEGEALTGIKNDIEATAKWFIDRGVTRVYITLGAEGVFCHDGVQGIKLPTQAVSIVNATGAGDAFMAGVVHAEQQGAAINESAGMGLKCAAIALQSKNAVNPMIKQLINKS
ncbi:MAG: hypothetical protein IK092_00575 [Muribaculaceae bacterium]|nr:hypothetical protein [Muribaculaceae bacterium]